VTSKKHETEIDWNKVADARRRGKKGTMRPGDQELCSKAFAADPERYKTLSHQIIDEITKEQQLQFEP
jgi:hypothetical protein